MWRKTMQPTSVDHAIQQRVGFGAMGLGGAQDERLNRPEHSHGFRSSIAEAKTGVIPIG